MPSMKQLSIVSAIVAATMGAVYGCSADSNTPGIDDGDSGGIPQLGDDGSSADTTVSGDDSSVTPDTGKKDSGKDAATNDGPTDANKFDAPISDGAPQGTPCSTPQAVEAQACGMCGVQYRGCLPVAGDAGYAWGPWGFCQNEQTGPNACDPNQTYQDETCGNCGTRPRLCQNDCTFATGLVCNEPANSCHPGDTEFVLGLSCDAGGREHTCDTTCQWGSYGACTTGPVNNNFLNIATAAGGTQTKKFTIPNLTTKIARLGISSSCPTTLSTSSNTNYVYIQVNNTTAKTASVSIWSSKTASGPTLDTIMAVYPGSIPPSNTDANARKNCMTGTAVNDECSGACSGGASACVGQWAGLCPDDFDPSTVTIPPGGAVTVYHAEYSTSGTGGDFNLSVRTDALN
jgi:hypothetical protein